MEPCLVIMFVFHKNFELGLYPTVLCFDLTVGLEIESRKEFSLDV